MKRRGVIRSSFRINLLFLFNPFFWTFGYQKREEGAILHKKITIRYLIDQSMNTGCSYFCYIFLYYKNEDRR